MPKTVVVALSGGVDSSVAALLLRDRGHRVLGVTLRLYDSCGAAGKSCCALEDALDARRVAAVLGIEHRVLDHQEAFERLVIAPFAAGYAAGQTPNPCILCNERVKFGTLWDYARELGADALATGHHARLRPRGTGTALWRAADPGKDQSYVLFSLTAEQRARTLFPCGEHRKDELRERARAAGLPTAGKPESQDICFVAGGDYAGFLEARGARGKAGLLRHVDGRVLGTHAGLHRFTVGQRKGLGVPAAEPLYVVDLDPSDGTVTVGPRESLGAAGFEATGWNWHLEPGESPPPEALVQVRYRQAPAPARLSVEAPGAVVVEWLGPPRAATPGQAAVAYAGERLLGGGWIRRRTPG